MTGQPDFARIQNTMGKMAHYLNTHNSICVSVSGGSDSDIIVHMIATYFRDQLPKIHFVFANTGLEYRATRQHLDYLRDRYNIQIDEVRGQSIVTAVRQYGIPILSKEFSKRISECQRGGSSSLKWLNRTEGGFKPSPKQKALARYLIANEIRVSTKCCDVSKKKPMFDFFKSVKADLSITGERRAEGGQRATAHTDCFEPAKSHPWDKYMPLFFWDDVTKDWYKQHENIRYSDCYEVWGMKRTGCVGCPFNSRVGRDLRLLEKYEPSLYRVCLNVFGESYRLMDQFMIHREPIFIHQETLFEEEFSK